MFFRISVFIIIAFAEPVLRPGVALNRGLVIPLGRFAHAEPVKKEARGPQDQDRKHDEDYDRPGAIISGIILSETAFWRLGMTP